ncbi:MAG TPA: TVP38/TMEM64 family protein [Tepidiformaceae bacterium]|nr:TVP38/TMEM64 family protein [Tepidiformaceae bacterium]
MTEERNATLEQVAFGGEDTPLLLKKRVVFGLVGAFALIVLAYFVTNEVFGLSYTIDEEPLQEWVDKQGAVGVIAFIGLMAISVLFAPIPNAPIFFAAGLAWGPVLGTLYCMIGLTAGSALAFWVARRVGRKHLPRLIGHKSAARLDDLVEHMGGRMVFWSRMIPAVNFDWISYVAGMTAVPFRVFIFYSALGMLFPTAVAVVAGDGLGRDFRITLIAGGVWIGVILVSAGYFWFRRHRYLTAQRELRNSGGAPTGESG